MQNCIKKICAVSVAVSGEAATILHRICRKNLRERPASLGGAMSLQPIAERSEAVEYAYQKNKIIFNNYFSNLRYICNKTIKHQFINNQ